MNQIIYLNILTMHWHLWRFLISILLKIQSQISLWYKLFWCFLPSISNNIWDPFWPCAINTRSIINPHQSPWENNKSVIIYLCSVRLWYRSSKITPKEKEQGKKKSKSRAIKREPDTLIDCCWERRMCISELQLGNMHQKFIALKSSFPDPFFKDYILRK